MLRLKSYSTTPLYIFLWLICSPILIYTQSGEAKSLEIGNKWVFEESNYFGNHYWFEEVVGDTVINLMKYACIKDSRLTGLMNYERADSSKIYYFYSKEETVIDFYDTSDSRRTITIDTIDFWGARRKEVWLYYYAGLGEYHYWYAKGIGLVRYSYEAQIHASTYGGIVAGIIKGIVYGDSTLVNVGNEQNGKPLGFSLFPNYPNPFNPVTTIQYAIPSLEHVSIIIYDMLGRQVAILMDEQKSAGSYHFEFNAHSLPSGVYYCRMQAGLFAETKKLVLLK